MRKCSVDGCENKHKGHGYCSKHYQQYKKFGYVLDRSRKDPNEIIEYEDYAEIILYNNQGEEKSRALIDLDDIDLIKEYRWCMTTEKYVSSTINGVRDRRIHNLIMNPAEGFLVDHINHNPLDNRKCNLRICTPENNARNLLLAKNNTSGFTGVELTKYNTWRVSISVNKKTIHIGTYKTKEEAIEARKQAEIDYYGEFAPHHD